MNYLNYFWKIIRFFELILNYFLICSFQRNNLILQSSLNFIYFQFEVFILFLIILWIDFFVDISVLKIIYE